MRAPFAFIFVALLTACASFPEVDATVTEDMRAAAYPALAPTSELEAAGAAPRLSETSAASFTGRVAALKSRAAALRGSVVGPADKARLRAGVQISATPEG